MFEYERRVRWCSTPQAIEDEVARLKTVPFFRYESHEVVRGEFQVIGVLGRERQFGGTQSLRVRLQYPDCFPAWEPLVFDHEKIFKPSAAGHQMDDYSLCLRFPARPTFSSDIDKLSNEVLGAALSWLIKREIFESGEPWPGEAEEHGYAKPFAKLAAEEALQTGIALLIFWAQFCVARGISPKMKAPCPCGGTKSVEACHSRLGELIRRSVFFADKEGQYGNG